MMRRTSETGPQVIEFKAFDRQPPDRPARLAGIFIDHPLDDYNPQMQKTSFHRHPDGKDALIG